MIGKELKNPTLKPRNVYNMNETEVLLALLTSIVQGPVPIRQGAQLEQIPQAQSVIYVRASLAR